MDDACAAVIADLESKGIKKKPGPVHSWSPKSKTWWRTAAKEARGKLQGAVVAHKQQPQ